MTTAHNITFITCDELKTDKLSCDFKLKARGGTELSGAQHVSVTNAE